MYLCYYIWNLIVTEIKYKEIFEAIYFGALTASDAIAKKDGSYNGSPISN